MNLVSRTTTEHAREFPPAPQEAFLSVSNARVQHIARALSAPGSSLVLTGESGCGKGYLAQGAAYAFEALSAAPVKRLVFQDFTDLRSVHTGPEPANTSEMSSRILEALQLQAADREVIMIALGIDRYDANEAAVLEHLVRERQIRFIGTAQQVVGAADRLARDPGVHQIGVEPFTVQEAEAFLSRIFGVDQLAYRTLERWHEATRGNPHALLTLALAADRRGVVQRARKIAWVSFRDEHAPEDFLTQLGELTPPEQATLDLVSFAAPLHEPALLQLLDADAVTSLMGRQILAVRATDNHSTALATNLPVLAEAVRTHMSPVHRAALAEQCFQALLADEATLSTALRLRLVRFGMESGHVLPIDWLYQAMRSLGRSGDLRFVLRLALAAMQHDQPQPAAEAIIRACDLAHFLQDRDALDESLRALAAFVSQPERLAAVPFSTQFTLAMTSICFNPEYDGRPDLALSLFSQWEHRWDAFGLDARRLTQACRMRVLALHGRLKDALEAGTHIEGARNLESEWLSAPARTFESLLRTQRGEFRVALELAETTRQIILLHEISPTLSGDLEGFAVFLAHWARGTTISANHAIHVMAGPATADVRAVQTQSGLVDLAVVLLALQEARWYEAADLTDRLINLLTANDPFGLTSMAYAASALALAALGDEDPARAALRRVDASGFGPLSAPSLSQALHGFSGILALQARHWLREPDLAERAKELTVWAREQDLPLIELEALDVIAHENATPDLETLARAEHLAQMVDPPIGDAILAHIRALSHANDDSTPDPEERLLSELGIWLPLPPVAELTGREREIALFTALGYSSKHIAERLHLSARTIETHLAHVYGKLGLNGREELRNWFSRRREAS